MINNEDFTKRLQKVIDYYNESASSFAENIGVQRSSISHILSGRNKPSLDFILKVLSSYPEVELYWLLNGKGSFPKSINTNSKEKDSVSGDLDMEVDKLIKLEATQNKEIERIVIFFTDGTFKNFQN